MLTNIKEKNGIFYTKKWFAREIMKNLVRGNKTNVFYDPTAGSGIFGIAARENGFDDIRSFDLIPGADEVKQSDFFSYDNFPSIKFSLATNLPFRTLRIDKKKAKNELLGPNPNIFHLFLIDFLKRINLFENSAIILPSSFLGDQSSSKIREIFMGYVSEVWNIDDGNDIFDDANVPSAVLFFSSKKCKKISYKDLRAKEFSGSISVNKKDITNNHWSLSNIRWCMAQKSANSYRTLNEMGVVFKKGEIDVTKFKALFGKGDYFVHTGKTIKTEKMKFDSVVKDVYYSERIVVNDIVNINKKRKMCPVVIKNSHAANSLVYVSDTGEFTIDQLLKYLESDFVNDYLTAKQYNNHLPIKILRNIPFNPKSNSKGFGVYDKIFKMSDYDLEIAKTVKKGGNWKQIPLAVAAKSKRIMKIRETGGRTTLYGRIDPNLPAYTVTTYFNRPGNGTYIHPDENRTLSLREAARIQTFPEDYLFVGNNRQLLMQVGNAIPPVFAKKILASIKKQFNVNSSLDLFAGAGGISLASEKLFKKNIASDYEKHCELTHNLNQPDTKFILGDVSNEETQKLIIKDSLKNKVDIIIGGPPCQGFSLAGKRFIDDPRNQLYKSFIDIVREVDPKVVVFENVVGIRSFNKGSVLKDVLENFEGMGYEVNHNVYDMSQYGIPQKRKRFILVASKSDRWNGIPKADELIPSSIAFDKNEYIKYLLKNK